MWVGVFDGTDFLVDDDRLHENVAYRIAVVVNGLALYYKENIPEHTIFAHIVCEMMAPYCQDKRAQSSDANKELIALMAVHIHAMHKAGTLVMTTVDYAVPAGFEDIVVEEGEEAVEPEPTFEQAMNYFVHLADHYQHKRYTRLEIAIHAYVSIVKRGNISESYIRKVSEGLQMDIGRPIAIREQIVKAVWTFLADVINDANIGQLLRHWLSYIPAPCVRTRTMIDQAAKSGITSFIIIGKAINKTQNFPWHQIRRICQVEWDAFEAGVIEVGDNEYFGYRRELGNAKSTNLKSLAWVCKEILIRIHGERALSRYGGWGH